MAKKELKHICKNCQLYNPVKNHCGVVILYEGQRMNPPTDPDTYCVFEDEYQSKDPAGNIDVWKPEIQEVKWWVENPETGQKSDKGVVKIEYPVGFFGKEVEDYEKGLK
jgi:hypothetical protein